MSKLKPSVSNKPPSRKTPFQLPHALQYGLEVVMRDRDGKVSSVRCCFCRYFGREEAQHGKRKCTQNVKLYKAPYRPQNYTEHNASAHAAKWAEYQLLNDTNKAAFFNDLPTQSNQLTAHYEGETSVLRFTFPVSIVDELIGKIFFNSDAENISLATALRKFGTVNDGVYNVVIKTPLRFALAIQHFSAGLSFRQTFEVIQQHYVATGNPKWRGMTDVLAGTYARILVATSFHKIGMLLTDPQMWEFAFAGDTSTHTDRSFMDQRIRLAVRGELVNLHLIAIPMFGGHTAQVQCDLITKVLDIAYGDWRSKLIGIASDGENSITGRHGGVVTLLEREATYAVLRVWCAAHQIDLAMKSGFPIVGGGEFVKTTKSLIVHLRRQKTLIKEMGSAAKKLTNRWLYMGNVLQWILQNHFCLAEYFDDNESPSVAHEWWVNAAVVYGITTIVNVTIVKIQAKDIVLSQQMAEIELLVDRLRNILSVVPVPPVAFSPGEADIVSKKYWLPEHCLIDFIKDQFWLRRSQNWKVNPDLGTSRIWTLRMTSHPEWTCVLVLSLSVRLIRRNSYFTGELSRINVFQDVGVLPAIQDRALVTTGERLVEHEGVLNLD